MSAVRPHFLSVALLSLLLSACFNDPSDTADSNPSSLPEDKPPTTEGAVSYGLPEVEESARLINTNERIFNAEAPIPSQCYTKTEGQFNPCYTCHQIYTDDRVNTMNDGFLQGDYGFSDVGVNNHWSNLFVDRSDWLEQVSDEVILEYINSDNYSGLAGHLQASGWQGFIPDLENYQAAASAFDFNGLALDGSHWVAFNYKPFPGTFWPTNGSTDDVVLRLDSAFRELNGVFNRDVYFINLSLIELTMKGLGEVTLWPVDEVALKIDLDQDGTLATTDRIKARSHYIGDASDIPVDKTQFPVGTQLMHSVRYVGVNDDGDIYPSTRMKELRYMKKVNNLTQGQISGRYDRERKEKFEGALPYYLDKQDDGYDNSQGWFVQGFIEDYDGSLRPQTKEEALFCMGCHSAIGTTIDSTFSFVRKQPGIDGWGYINIRGMQDAPSLGDTTGGIQQYLERVGGGSEFRENPEMQARWFNDDGSVNVEAVQAADVYELITPSRRRALDLNKAYSHIVRHQSFRHGRDASWIPAENVIESVTAHDVPLRDEHRQFGWELRLDWQE